MGGSKLKRGDNMRKGIASIFPMEWFFQGDVDPASYGGKWFRDVSVPEENRRGLWQVIELTNMDEACGSDNEGQARYAVELSEVCLYEIDPRDGASFCGYDLNDPTMPVVQVVEAAHSCGQRAPMAEFNGNNAWALLREAKAEANRQDARNGANIYRMIQLQRPVNKLGSTAAEFARGDVESAMIRGIKANDPSARIVAKLYGIDPDQFKKES